MLNVGGLKAAAKRTAFGDVSNTVRPVGTTQDDSAVSGKSNGYELVKPVKIQDKQGSFLRPAQRPINAAILKGMLSNKPSNTGSDTSLPAPVVGTKQPVVEVQQLQSQPSKRRNTLIRRSTVIYKDEDVEEDGKVESSGTVPSNAPVQQSLGPRQHKSQPQLRKDQPVLRRTQSKHLTQPEPNSRPVTAETIYHEASETLAEEPADEKTEDNPTELYESYMRMINRQADEEAEEQRKEHKEGAVGKSGDSEILAAASNTEPEEYWDEEDEDAFDEQGYTTAHSLRSRGDTTTGGAMTLNLPKQTAKIRKELAAAKAEVEAARTEEDIEDEAWDTSMVAEYGDEIFEYMRELEVSLDMYFRLILLYANLVILPVSNASKRSLHG